MPETSQQQASAAAEYAYLHTPAAIRERALLVYQAAEQGTLEHFRLNERALPALVDRVIAVSRAHYPDLRNIPYHGRYRHFDAGGVPRLAAFQASLASLSPDDMLRARAELVITSVLLDAGAGSAWHYHDTESGTLTRSEGLAVASYHLFMSGALGRSGRPVADAGGLCQIDAERLGHAFQVSLDNPLAGLAGRVGLLTRLGQVVRSTPSYFEPEDPRLGDLAVFLKRSARAGRLPASAVLAAVLSALGPIWPSRATLAENPLGDVWRHTRFGWLPFHKLSQWLSYSLLEPLESAGLVVEGLAELTGLPEYRNGGLFLDAGVLELRNAGEREREHAVSSELVLEWRALTVILLDRLASAMQTKLGLSPDQLPLARVLEGGSWQAGRAIARELRPGGEPPLRIQSDGTVF